MPRGRHDELAAIAPHVEARGEGRPSLLIPDAEAGVPEEDVLAAAAGLLPHRARERPVLRFELGQALVATVTRIVVERDDPRVRAGRDPEIGRRAVTEPAGDHRDVGRGLRGPVFEPRMLAGGVARVALLAGAPPVA
jgi:hypothetical protein